MDLDEPLDFESEDLFLKPCIPTKKRRKLIGLDDLLTDHYKETSKRIEKETKKKKSVKKSYNSDEEEDISRNRKEALLSKFVDECEKQVHEIRTEDKIPLWDVKVFGNQKTPPPLACPQLENCMLLSSFMNDELNSVLELSAETGQTFLEGLLINGWLQKLVFIRGHVEESVAAWTFNLMLYSSNEDLRVSACDFWCSILQSKNEVDEPSLKVDWYPAYAEVQRALKVYGYLFDPSIDVSSLPESDSDSDSDSDGPSQNIRCWIRFLATCCQVRSTCSIFSNSEVEELLGAIISFFLDRRLEALSFILYECLFSVINFFTEDEWNISREKVAKLLASRVEKDLNCLRLVECISGVDTRSKNLRRELAFQILLNCFDKKVSDGEEILRLLMSVKVKDQGCDFFMLYIYLVLGENWLLFNPLLEEKPFLHEMWGVFLRSCSSQISSTDMRSYASKVRYKASYLLQMSIQRGYL